MNNYEHIFKEDQIKAYETDIKGLRFNKQNFGIN